jgi:hypothetical protein
MVTVRLLKSSIQIIGSVIDPVGGVESFRINGVEIVNELDAEGNFTYPIDSKQGMNLIVAIAEDPSGSKTILAQSYYYSPIWYEMDFANQEVGKVDNGIMLFLSQAFFDDDVHNHAVPDDIATILELTLKTLDLNSLIPNPIWTNGTYRVNLTGVSFDSPLVNLDCVDGGIRTYIHLKNILLTFDIIGECNFIIDWCPDTSGWATVDDVWMDYLIELHATDGVIFSNVVEDAAEISGVEIGLDGALGFLFNWLIDFIFGFFENEVGEMLGPLVTDQLSSIIGGLADMLNFEQEMEIANPMDPTGPPVKMALDSTMQELYFLGSGMFMRLKATIQAAKEITKNPLGSIGRSHCLDWDPSDFEFTTEYYSQIGLNDDFLNQILFSVWWGGLLDMDVPIEQFVGDEGLVIPGFGSLDDLGIQDLGIRTEFFLPPILTSCNLNELQEEVLEMHIGDMYLELSMTLLNEPVVIGLFVSAAAEAYIEIIDNPDGSQSISIALGEFDPIVSQVTHISEGLEGAEGFMSMLVQGIIVPMIIDTVAEAAMTSFQLPAIDLSSLSPMLPPGITLQFEIDEFERYQGYTGLYAHINAVQ